MGPGDVIDVPPSVTRQDIDGSADRTLECGQVRSDREAVVVNIDVNEAKKPSALKRLDPSHRI